MAENPTVHMALTPEVTSRKMTLDESTAWRRRDRAFRRNLEYWNANCRDVEARCRAKWVLIYGGDTLEAFDDMLDMRAALEALPEPLQQGAMSMFVRSRARA